MFNTPTQQTEHKTLAVGIWEEEIILTGFMFVCYVIPTRWILNTTCRKIYYSSACNRISPVSVATRSKASICSRSPAEIVGSKPRGAWISVCHECCILSNRGLCDELITRPEESYRLWCVVVCDLENLVNMVALGHWGLSQKRKSNIVHERNITSQFTDIPQLEF